MRSIGQITKPEGCFIIILLIPILITDCCRTIGFGGFACHRFTLIGQFARWDAQKRIDDLLGCILQPIPDYTILYYELSGFSGYRNIFLRENGLLLQYGEFHKIITEKMPGNAIQNPARIDFRYQEIKQRGA